MKRTQRKDALRNIWKQWVSFLSVLVIAMLGVTMFLGMNYGAAAIGKNAAAFYDEANYRDIEIISTRLLSPEDMEFLKHREGVLDGEGVLMTQGKAAAGALRKDVSVVSVPERINHPLVLEGRLPTDPGSCAVEESLMGQMGWQIGETIEIFNEQGQTPPFLREGTFVVTGVVVHPDHVCGSVPDTPYILVPSAAFDLDIFQGSFMKAELLVDAPREGGRFAKAYKTAVGRVLSDIDGIREERAQKRQQEVDAQIKEAVEESLTLNWGRLEDAKEGMRRIIRDAVAKNLGQEVADSIQWATVQAADLSSPHTTAMTFWLTDTVRANLHLTLRENMEALVKSLALPDEALRAAFAFLVEDGVYSPEAANQELVDRSMTLLGDYEAQYNELVRACLTWDEALIKYQDGSFWSELGLPGVCRWIVTDDGGNLSFVQLGSSADSLSRLQSTFSLLFVAVGALVIYATVSKMIDEQRSLVGATKALGFYGREIFAKYLAFGLSATLLGALLGALIARFGVLPFLLNGYQIYYSIPLTRGTLTVWPTLAVFAAGLLLSFLAVWFACRRLLKTPAVALLQAAAPRGAQKASDRPSRLSLYSRLIVRNIRSDLRRVVVTVISVAGCCALVVVGFTLRHAVDGSVTRQFTDIVRYDGMFRFDPGANPEAAETLAQTLGDAGAETCFLTDAYCTIQVRNLDVEELMCGDLSAINGMFRLYDAGTGAPLALSDEGIYVPKRFSEYYGVEKGDTLELALNATETVQAPVAGVFNNYMNRIVFMSDGCFRSLFGRAPVQNAAMVRLNGADGQALNEAFSGVGGYGGYTPSDSFRALFKSATSVMNAVMVLFIVMAAILAGVVLLNLTNIYVLQKKRELTVMRVNGFTTREAIAYVTRETVATTALGVLLGVGLGAGLGYAILRALEPPLIQFDRTVSPLAWLAGALITVLFSIIVNRIALRRVKHLKLTDVA